MEPRDTEKEFTIRFSRIDLGESYFSFHLCVCVCVDGMMILSGNNNEANAHAGQDLRRQGNTTLLLTVATETCIPKASRALVKGQIYRFRSRGVVRLHQTFVTNRL